MRRKNIQRNYLDLERRHQTYTELSDFLYTAGFSQYCHPKSACLYMSNADHVVFLLHNNADIRTPLGVDFADRGKTFFRGSHAEVIDKLLEMGYNCPLQLTL